MSDSTQCSIYRLRLVLNGVSPLVWRRFLLSSETNLTDLHKLLGLAFGWSDFYLESISKWGLRGSSQFRSLFSLHSRIPTNKGLPELVIQHLCPHLEQIMRAGLSCL